ncbi:MAG: hypothetical protein M3Z96_13370 [Pseudomonadota bacterium]|nr:hypothetical protein [Pseudomonadota bacterium]
MNGEICIDQKSNLDRWIIADLDETFAAGLNVQAMERFGASKRSQAGSGGDEAGRKLTAGPPSLCLYVEEREVRCRAKLCRKNAAPPRDARKNRVQADTFSSLSRVCA